MGASRATGESEKIHNLKTNSRSFYACGVINSAPRQPGGGLAAEGERGASLCKEIVKLRWGDNTYAQKSVLIVSDQSFGRQVIGQALGRLGFGEVHKAATAQAALDICGSCKLDLIFCEVEMQPMGGFDFLGAYRRAAVVKRRDVPVIFLSGSSDAEMVRRAIGLGAAGYLVKPVSFRTIREHVAKVLGRAALPAAG